MGNILHKIIIAGLTSITLLPAVTADKPNIILIFADDLGLGMLVATGKKLSITGSRMRNILIGTEISSWEMMEEIIYLSAAGEKITEKAMH